MISIKKIAGVVMGCITLVVISVPMFVGAQVIIPTVTTAGGSTATGQNPQYVSNVDGGVGSADPQQSNFQLVTCQGVDDPRTTVKEVPCDYNQLIKTFDRVVRFVLWLVTPIVVGMLMFTGFKYITAGGDANLIADAKRMFTPILLGVFFIFAGWLIVYTILDKLLAENAGGVPKTDIVPAKVGP